MVPPIVEVVLLTTMAGAAIPLGAWIASIERIQPNWLRSEFRHSVTAFGGGVLISAVALVLVPHGVKGLSMLAIAVAIFSGGWFFMTLDMYLDQSQTSASQLAAMLADFIPEAIALGAAFATGGSMGLLLAILIALQNFPEGFNAYRELAESTGWPAWKLLLLTVAIVPLGPIAGLLGLYVLSAYPPAVNAIMLFAAGGILYLTFQDLAPQAKLERAWGPPFGAVVGFLFGLMGDQLLHGS